MVSEERSSSFKHLSDPFTLAKNLVPKNEIAVLISETRLGK